MVFDIVHMVIPIVIVIIAVVSMLLKDLRRAALMVAVMSLLLSFEFFLLDAPFVALVQIVVGFGLTTYLLLRAVKMTSRLEEV